MNSNNASPLEQRLAEARSLVQQLEQEATLASTDIPNKIGTTADAENLVAEVVSAIKPGHRDPDHGDKPESGMSGLPTHYYITYVTAAMQQKTVLCSREIWLWQTQFQPWFDVHADWIFNKDQKKDNLVVGVIRKPHLRQGPLAARFNADPDDLILQKTGNTYEPVNLPRRFTPDVLEEALAAINNAGHVKPGNTVGRFFVKQVQADESLTVVVLDIKS